MGNTSFFRNPDSISWKDIFSESFKKHNSKDLERALMVGTSYDTATEENMIQKWTKPWVWWRVFVALGGIGLAFYIMSILVQYALTLWCTLIILTMVTPITTMVIAWEMNIPRNISIFNMLTYFAIGGVLSLIFSALVNSFLLGSDYPAWVAPFAEEPGKLFASIVLMNMLHKNGKKIYGLTGLAVGAGVGTGTTLFESWGYVLTKMYTSGYAAALDVVRGRSIPNLNAHMMFCVPYVAIIALQFHKNGDWKKSIWNSNTMTIFGFSVLMHALGNSQLFCYTEVTYLIRSCIITILELSVLLYIVRQCLEQIVEDEKIEGGFTGRRRDFLCISSDGMVLHGKTWEVFQSVLVGRSSECHIRFPGDVRGVSRKHCRLDYCRSGREKGWTWSLTDLGSTYGTYLNGVRIEPGKAYELSQNGKSKIAIGSEQVILSVGIGNK